MKTNNFKSLPLFSMIILILSSFILLGNEKGLIGKSPNLIGISPDTLKAEHIILVFIPSCSHCRKAAVRLEKDFEKNGNITGLTATEYKNDLKEFRDSFNITFPVVTVEKPQLRNYFKKIPRYVYVKDSLIINVTDSLLVSPFENQMKSKNR